MYVILVMSYCNVCIYLSHERYLSIRTYVHTYIRTYVHTYIRTYAHTYIRTYKYINTYNQRSGVHNVSYISNMIL